jgi:hypothetical protein
MMDGLTTDPGVQRATSSAQHAKEAHRTINAMYARQTQLLRPAPRADVTAMLVGSGTTQVQVVVTLATVTARRAVAPPIISVGRAGLMLNSSVERRTNVIAVLDIGKVFLMYQSPAIRVTSNANDATPRLGMIATFVTTMRVLAPSLELSARTAYATSPTGPMEITEIVSLVTHSAKIVKAL